MSTYVMSDIHGFYQTFLNALNTIEFTDDDELYIIGDVIDRGTQGVKILQYVMNKPNIHMIMGNHEYMCSVFFSKKPDEASVRRWNRNGNFYTLKGFDQLNKKEKSELLDFIKSLPVEVDVKVKKKKFHLVHGYLGDDDYHKIWNRPKQDDKPKLKKNETLIIGHTPVCEYVCPGTDEEMYVYSSKLTKKKDHFRIFHGNGFIDIDCCIGVGFSAARLGILRLEDMQEFYEPVVED